MTRLFAEPLTKPLLDFILRKRIAVRIFKAATHLVQHIEVVLDLFQRAILRKLVKQQFDLLLAGHDFSKPSITNLCRKHASIL